MWYEWVGNKAGQVMYTRVHMDANPGVTRRAPEIGRRIRFSWLHEWLRRRRIRRNDRQK